MNKRKQMSTKGVNLNDDSSAYADDAGGADFAAQFERSFGILWVIAAGILRNRSLADDAVQEAGIIALSKYEQFEPGTNFTAWMGQIVRHVAKNMARKEYRRKSASLDDSHALTEESYPGISGGQPQIRLGARGELPAEQEHFDDRLIKALYDVSDVARACLLLKTLGELDYTEISRIMEIPEGTAMSHVHRTRKLLRNKLADLGKGLPSAKRGPI